MIYKSSYPIGGVMYTATLPFLSDRRCTSVAQVLHRMVHIAMCFIRRSARCCMWILADSTDGSIANGVILRLVSFTNATPRYIKQVLHDIPMPNSEHSESLLGSSILSFQAFMVSSCLQSMTMFFSFSMFAPPTSRAKL